MTAQEYIDLRNDLSDYNVETDSSEYDDYILHQIDVSGSKCSLMCLVEYLNRTISELRLRETDIQETGASCLLRFEVDENF